MKSRITQLYSITELIDEQALIKHGFRMSLLNHASNKTIVFYFLDIIRKIRNAETRKPEELYDI